MPPTLSSFTLTPEPLPARMKKVVYKTILTVCVFLLILTRAVSQPDSARMVKYSPAFRFQEGIYMNFEQVKTNRPIPFAKIDFNLSPDHAEFIDQLLQQKELILFDLYGVRTKIPLSDVWGYSRNGALFIQYDGEFCRIPVIGSISHFVATVVVRTNSMNDPYNRNPYSYNPGFQPTYTSREQVQFVLDFSTGKVSEFDRENLAILLMVDPPLYEEFNALKKRKQNQALFAFLRRFNERNPLYITP